MEGMKSAKLRQARHSLRFVAPLVDAFDPLLRPRNQRNVILGTDLFPHLAHHVNEYRWSHPEVITYLPVGSSSGKSSQHD